MVIKDVSVSDAEKNLLNLIQQVNAAGMFKSLDDLDLVRNSLRVLAAAACAGK